MFNFYFNSVAKFLERSTSLGDNLFQFDSTDSVIQFDTLSLIPPKVGAHQLVAMGFCLFLKHFIGCVLCTYCERVLMISFNLHSLYFNKNSKHICVQFTTTITTISPTFSQTHVCISRQCLTVLFFCS